MNCAHEAEIRKRINRHLARFGFYSSWTIIKAMDMIQEHGEMVCPR